MRLFLALTFLALAPSSAFANARPEAKPDRYVFRQGESVDVRPPGVLGNDADADGDSLYVEPAEPAAMGRLILFPDGSFSYTPDERFEGSDRFTYRACDDGSCSEPIEVQLASDGISAPLASRPDRFELVAGAAPIELDVLANDRFEAARIVGGRLDLVSEASRGDLEVLSHAKDSFRFRYRPHSGAVGADRFRYRLCEAAERCVEADVEVSILPVAPVRLDVSGGAGFADVPLRGLPALPAPRLTFTASAKPSSYAFPISIDMTPLEPWAGGGAAQTLFSTDGGEFGRDLRINVELEAEHGDVDLYVGRDDDGNRRATSDEVVCVSAGVAGRERCVLELTVPAQEYRSWWAYAHNRDSRPTSARVRVQAVDLADSSPLVWTAPGRMEAGAPAAFRVSWFDQALLPGEVREAWMNFESEPGTSLGWVPVSLVGFGREVAPRLLRSGEPVRFDLPAGTVAEALVLDVPQGSASFKVSAVADGAMTLSLHRAPAPDGTEQSVAINMISSDSKPVARAHSDDGVAAVEIHDAPAGRWLVRIGEVSADLAEVAVEVELVPQKGFESRLRPGLYAPPGRSGEGLMVDRAGGEWSGIWYLFDDTGVSTWLYLQGQAPADGAAWTPTIYRSSIGSGGQRLAIVGRGNLATVDDGAPVWSFEIDGRVGSQRLFDFGRGCPFDRGAPRDLSGLWYDPTLAGEGYGLWITSEYEFYGLFTHDARGEPRYLSAEGGGFSAFGSRRLPLAAYRSACLFCPRSARLAETVGDFERTFSFSLTSILTRVTSTLGAGVPGGLFRNETLERLGGEAGGLGCPSL
jgi:hypothetical protein